MKSRIFGTSAGRLPIMAYKFGTGRRNVLILGGVHGDEIEGVIAALALLQRFQESFPFQLNLTLVPMFNMDGVLRSERKNIRGVDLNRNLPTNDWSPEVATERYHPGPEPGSEPENKALVSFLEVEKPSFVLSLHSWKPMLNVNGGCLEEAQAISTFTGYSIEESIGYPTPGCLGTYCGLEREMPTLTYEIERGLAAEDIFKTHIPAIWESLKVTEGK